VEEVVGEDEMREAEERLRGMKRELEKGGERRGE
jgi:hypothetical protein